MTTKAEREEAGRRKELDRLRVKYNRHREQLVNEGVEFIPVNYEYKDKNKSFEITVIPGKRLAAITERIPREDGEFDLNIVRESDLSYADICYYFPPLPQFEIDGYEYNMKSLFRSILYELYMDVVEGSIPKPGGNVRGVWYSHFIHTVQQVLGLGESNSVKTAINGAWGDMIVGGVFTYEDLGIVSAKENVRISRVRDSPFSHIIVAVEKEDLYEDLEWIPDLFRNTLIAAGGQPSRAVARAFIKQLLDEGVDLDQDFHMCAISDCDPAGYYIQASFRDQLEKAIEFYGGTGRISIDRLFVRKDQITERLLEHDGVPCADTQATKAAAKKAENTKWEMFCDITNGGLYRTPPPVWNGPPLPLVDIDGVMKCRAKVELNAFGKDVIALRVVREILQIIEDHSLIMIPEIMRVFNELKMLVGEERFAVLNRSQIEPVIRQYLAEIDRLVDNYYADRESDIDQVWDDYRYAVQDIKDDYYAGRRRGLNDIDDKVRPEMSIYTHLTILIDQLEELRGHVEDRMFAKVDQELDDLEDLHDQYKHDLFPHQEERRALIRRYNQMSERYEELAGVFRNECSTVFGPAKAQLKAEVLEAYGDIDVRFVELEGDDRTQPHIARLLTDADQLVEEGITCFDHSAPAFQDTTSLAEAAEAQHRNIGQFREGFTPEFEDSMKALAQERGEVLDFEVDTRLLEVAELDDQRLEEFDEQAREKIVEEFEEE